MKFDLVVIGAGPGGYVCAIKAAQLGLQVAIIDKREEAGGTCLNVGCIPSKALLTSSHKYYEARYDLEKHGIKAENWHLDIKKMMARKDAIVNDLTKGIEFLFRKNKITFYKGEATLLDANRVQVLSQGSQSDVLEATYIVLATGSEPTPLPGIEIDEDRVLSSTGALSLTKPPKSLVVIGGGYIGLELGSVWARLGSLVTVVEYFDRIVPMMDYEVGTAFQKTLENQGILFKLERKLVQVLTHEKNLTLHVLPAQAENSLDNVEIITCSHVLISTGRRPYTKNLGLGAVNIMIDNKGFIAVNEHYQTSCPNIFAIGDVIPGPMLAHKAEEEGIAVAELLAGQAGHVNYQVIPSIVYTDPEVASVGYTEEQLKQYKIPYKVGKFPFLANSRAKAVGNTQGFVKIISDEATDRVLGVHIIGEQAGNMISEAAIAMEFQASAEDIARTCHAHPTHAEALKEAAMAAYSKPIHI